VTPRARFVNPGDTRPGYGSLVKPLRITGAILSGGGGVGLVVAITAMDRISSCGNGYDAPCPPGIANDFFLMGGAIVAIAVGAVMTLGMGLLVGVLTAAVTAIVYSLTVAPSQRTGEYITAGVSLGVGALAYAITRSVLKQVGRLEREQTTEDRQFRERATMVPGTVIDLRDTGVTINNNPQAAITVSYARDDGTPAQLEMVQVLPRLEIPRRGDPATVWYDPVSDKAQASLGSPEAHTTPA
jgi:hypothetical protein